MMDSTISWAPSAFMQGAGSRPQRASLRGPDGERLGRFALAASHGRRSHHWEWFERWWPDHAFLMVPDAREPQPTRGLSQQAELPGRLRRPMPGHHIGLGADCRQMYDVCRFDDDCRQLAVLTVSDASLEWWEVGMGGALELAPASLLFVPRVAAIAAHRVSRCILQRRQRTVDGLGDWR